MRILSASAHHLCAGAALSIAMLLLPVTDAWASTGCTAVNSGVFNLTDGSSPGAATATQADFAVGDQLTVTYVANSANDTFVLSPTGGGAALDNFHPTFGTTVRNHTLTGSQLSLTLSITNGHPFGGTNRTTATCTPAAVTTVTAISPNSGPTAGGSSVTITGTLFTDATAVTIGGSSATGVTVVNATTITATTPAHAAGTVDVVVTAPGGTGTGTSLYTFVTAPTVTAISPVNGTPVGGTTVTITGTNFTGATAVTIGGAPATGVTVVNATTITATTPAHAAGSVNVAVTTPGGTGTGSNLYTYAGIPTITSIDPDLGTPAGGDFVRITGTNLTGATVVTIGGAPATGVTVVNATTITATTPPHAPGTTTVAVTTPGGTGTGARLFTYAGLPTVTSVSPNGGPIAGGTTITITGADLDGASAVTIDGVAATNISVVNSTTITAKTPAHAAGHVNVAITTPGGIGIGTSLYTYRPSLTLSSSPSGATQVGEPYSQTNVASGGTPDYRYSVSAGSLPAGTSLDASTGLVSGTPTTSGAFSYTIEVADSGATPPTATQIVSGSIAAIQTTTALTSSLNPGLVEQPVTLTARVTPASATGTVTFKTDTATLCSAAPLAGAAATCTTRFAASGTYSVVAMYDGTSALGASASPVLLQTVSDQRVKAVEVIGTFVNRRNDLIAANEPDASSQIDRLVEFGDSTIPAAVTASRSAELLSAISGATSLVSPSSSAAVLGDMALRLIGAVTGPVRVNGMADGAMRLAVGTSLRQMRRYGVAQTGGRGAAPRRSSPFDIWFDGKYASFSDKRASHDIDGHFRIVSVGSDYVVSRTFLVGGMVQFDGMRQSSNAQAGAVSGHGWLAGPYATMRLADRLFWQGRAAWGRSTNNVSPFQTYTEEVGSSRWLVASTLAGRLDLGGWVFRPSVSVAYVEDVAASYVDTFGIAIPEVRSGLGQAKVGPQFDSHYQVSRRIALEPRLGLHVISNFGATTAAGGLGQVDGTNTGPIGTRARGEIGLNTLTTRGFGIDLSGSYDGIGATDYSAFAGRVMVRVPFGP